MADRVKILKKKEVASGVLKPLKKPMKLEESVLSMYSLKSRTS